MSKSSCSRNIKKKKPHRCKVNKKIYSSKSIGMWDRNVGISKSNLANLNEVLRVHKLQRAEGKGSWKLVPKDSCEVYKDRRKRQIENRRKKNDDDKEEYFENKYDRDEKKSPGKKSRDRKKKKEISRKPHTTRRKSKKRTRRDSSLSSTTSTNYTSTMSYSSVSEME